MSTTWQKVFLVPRPRKGFLLSSTPKRCRPYWMTRLSTRMISGVRDRFLIELLYVTGMRRAELIALKDSDIDLHASTLKVTGKGNKQRIIPFSNDTKEKLHHYRTVRDAQIKNKSDFLLLKKMEAPSIPSWCTTLFTRTWEHPHANQRARTCCATPSRPGCSTTGPSSTR